MNLFMLGEFTLNSGTLSSWKLECDALTDKDIRGLAEIVKIVIGPFYKVRGVPRGGLRLEEALKPFETGKSSDPYLIVDDVLTTGNSINKLRQELLEKEKIPFYTFRGCVIFARGKCLEWVKPICQLPKELWLTK